MAEGLGFEPRKELPLCRFSRPVLSTAQPSFQRIVSVLNIYITMFLNQIIILYKEYWLHYPFIRFILNIIPNMNVITETGNKRYPIV